MAAKIPASCSARNCPNKWSKDEDRPFFKFPLHDAELNKKWLAAVGRNAEWRPTKQSALCSDHFTETDFQYEDSGPIITPKAVPTVFKRRKVEILDIKDIKDESGPAHVHTVHRTNAKSNKAAASAPNQQVLRSHPTKDHDYHLSSPQQVVTSSQPATGQQPVTGSRRITRSHPAPTPQRLKQLYDDKVVECRKLQISLTSANRKLQLQLDRCAKLERTTKELETKLASKAGGDHFTTQVSGSMDGFLKSRLLQHMDGLEKHKLNNCKTYVIL